MGIFPHNQSIRDGFTRVFELVEDHIGHEAVGGLVRVGLDAADEVRTGLTQRAHQGMERFL